MRSSPPERYSLLGLALALYLIVVPLDFVQVAPGVSLPRLMAILPIVAAFPRLLQLRFSFDRILLGVYLYLVSMLLSLTFSFHFEDSLRAVTSIAANVAFAVVFSGFTYTERESRLFVRSLLLGAWVVVGAMVLSPGYVGTTWVTERVVANLGGSQQDPNKLCEWFVFPASYYVYRAAGDRSYLHLGAGLVFLSAAAFTGSRGGLTGIIAGILVSIAYYAYFERHAKRLVLLAPLAAPIVHYSYSLVLRWLPDTVASRFAVVNLLAEGSGQRGIVWRELVQSHGAAPLANKLFGFGGDAARNKNTLGLAAHNTPLEHLIDYGLLGLLAYSFLFYTIARAAWRTRHAPYVGSVAGIGFILLTLSGPADKPIFCLLLLILVALRSAPSISQAASVRPGSIARVSR